MESVKGRYPWRLGAPSYVIPDAVLPNVELLAPLVDDVQLLFFESRATQGMDHAVPVQALADLAAAHELTYTVHLPTDIFLGHPDPGTRSQGVAEIEALVALLAPLGPRAFDLHLNRQPELAPAEWREHLAESLALLRNRLGSEAGKIAIENIDYPFALVQSLVAAQGFSLCLDLGHVLYYQHDWPAALALASQANHLHLHGVRDGRDHRPLSFDQASRLVEAGLALAQGNFCGVLTLEVYRYEYLRRSCEVLAELWQSFTRSSD
ncbi:MAG: cobamide remodeling phosphodiesterase CbiR [Thermodesulfobacteriota bacterium]